MKIIPKITAQIYRICSNSLSLSLIPFYYLVNNPAIPQHMTQITIALVLVQTYPAFSGSQIA